MKTKVTFKVLADHCIKSKTIPIEHNFKPYEETFNGHTWIVSVENQVMEMLDNMDKKDMMDKYGWEMIIDYYPQKKRYSIQDEINEFLTHVTPLIPQDMIRQFSAIAYEYRKNLFGKGKSHNTKLKEILDIISITNKTILGVLDVLKHEFKQDHIHVCENKKLQKHEKLEE